MRPELILFFPMKLHYRIPTGSIPTGYNPMNQTHRKGNIFHRVPILWKSYELKEA
jgi:hypothetical protein